jgi:hypothetical protein
VRLLSSRDEDDQIADDARHSVAPSTAIIENVSDRRVEIGIFDYRFERALYAVSGVRSSCETSETNSRRDFSSRTAPCFVDDAQKAAVFLVFAVTELGRK